ncbi:hypothetical protein TRFO_36523 [Tritrichomonas foetus]|uniref:Importin N-terminal domain-containing protein n=1 Tax=Tritrichomonas foetus TaxID=1144522 RepID=A0A1J4JDU1_9EUKA|nr:hypothetical protein TRFO_36523 [Tritrichomonas foetus]|eukprot:OHS97322.1 hypothetical protein TRFO_36523 [Tritrichomonas foetus]
MDDSLLSLLVCFTNPDNEMRSHAEEKIQDLLQNEPISFSQFLFLILQNCKQIPPIIVNFSLILLKKIFSRATIAKKSNDQRLSYQLIPIEFACEIIPILFQFFQEFQTNPALCNGACYLLGQIAVYLLNFDVNHHILITILDQINAGINIIPNLKTFLFILDEEYLEINFIKNLTLKIQEWIQNPQFPIDAKPFLILMIKSLIIYLSDILLTEEDNKSFMQMMMILSEVPQFKYETYEFWTSLIENVPDLFCYATGLPQMSMNDLSMPDQDENVILSILRMWTSLAIQECDIPESTSNIVNSLIPVFLPFLFQLAENTIDIDVLPSDECYSIYTGTCECITSFAKLNPDLMIPILLRYGEQAVKTENVKIQEIGLFALKSAIFHISDTDKYFPICSHYLQLSIRLLDDPSIRIVVNAVEMIYNINYLYPTLYDYSLLLQKLILLMQTPIYMNASVLILEIARSQSIQANINLIDSLLNIGTHESIDCARELLEINPNDEVLVQISPKIINMIQVIINNETVSNSFNNSIHNHFILNPLLMIIGLAIDLKNEIFVQNQQNFILMFIKCYETYYNSPALRNLSISLRISQDPQLMSYLIPQIIECMDCQQNQELIFASLDSIIFDLCLLDLSPTFHEFVRAILTLQANSSFLMVKIKCLEAINSLHRNYPQLMQPYTTRLLTLFNSAVVSFKKIEDYEDSYEIHYNLLSVLLKESLLFLQIMDKEVILQGKSIAFQSIQCALIFCQTNDEFNLMIFDLLAMLIQNFSHEVKQFILGQEDLKLLIQSYIDPNDLQGSLSIIWNCLTQ